MSLTRLCRELQFTEQLFLLPADTHTHREITIFNAHQDAVKAIYKKKAFKKGSFVVI